MERIFDQWLAAVFSHPDLLGAFVIAGKTATIYLFLTVGLRLLGKRELGQMSIYDLVLIVVVANAVQNAMVGDDTSLVGGLVAATTLLILNRGVTWLLVERPELRRWFEGEPVLIVKDGRMLERPMRREGVTRDHVWAAMREHGISQLDGVQMGVLEVDGAISIVPKDLAVRKTHRRFRGLRVQ